nr:hypothetical protein [Streptomyces chartreusis]
MVGTRACPTRRGGPETAGPRATGPGPGRHEVLAFAAVGLLAYAVDLALFTCLRGPAALDPLTAKAVAVNAAGAVVQLLCLTVSHYGLGFTSQLADTVSGAGIGMAPATVLRFWGTRTLVFPAEGRVGSWTG